MGAQRNPTETGSAATEEREAARAHLPMPIDVRSLSLAVLAVLASLFALHWAKEVLVPIFFGTVVSYALTPLVDRLERYRVPRIAAAMLVLTLITSALGWGAWKLSGQASAFVDTLPRVTQKLRELTQSTSSSNSTIAKVQEVAKEIEAAGSASSASLPPMSNGATESHPAEKPQPQGAGAPEGGQEEPAHVIVDQPTFDIRNYAISGTLGVLAFFGQLSIAFLVTLFLLASGSTFRRKMIKLAGPRFSQKKITIETLDEINAQIQRYLLVQIAVSAVVGVATWIAFSLFGLNQSAIWGVVAAVSNFIPYLGAVLLGVGSAVTGLIQLGSVQMALAIGATSFAIHIVVGNLLTPWWMGRASRMSTFAVFVCVVVFGWLWGVSGLLLGVPILMVIKSICDRVEDLRPIGELLAD